MIYFDNSATTQPTDGVISAMQRALRDGFFNPSAAYSPALNVENELNEVRRLIASTLSVKAERVIFTSGGTESDNLAVLGISRAARKPGRILYSAVEHPAVKAACKDAEFFSHKAEQIPVDSAGMVDLTALEKMLDESVLLICVMQVNNETGTVQPIDEIEKLRSRLSPEAVLHIDGVQGYLRSPISLKAFPRASYALSSHKLHGPKGEGALVIAEGVRCAPRQVGGGQEKDRRSGTENTSGIIGMGEAIKEMLADAGMHSRLLGIKKRLFELISSGVPEARLNGEDIESPAAAPHILNIAFPSVRSETLLHALEGEEIYVSMGSACSAHARKPSETLVAMGLSAEMASSSIRFSFGRLNTIDECEITADAVKRNYELLKRYQRR
ncbi:MAG: cysteine desulfurase family protein [Eubacteriales bacterium]|nr:cysteine desulfurase family protein [Eubacteriales bacterium]MDD3882228.1 cysteine desulfurase family protein [Eubacteriales bacterium]MDD4512577.1 cysteine desulfurase family protein [Eubacteriales bacterium]